MLFSITNNLLKRRRWNQMPASPFRKRVTWWIKLLVPALIAMPFCFRWVVIDALRPYASPALGVTLLTALYWVLEPISIVVAAFIPIVLMPFFHVTTAKGVANQMWTDTSIVFLGGFLFSIVMVRWNLHSRIALKTVLIFGLRPWLLLLGMMLVTTFLSMWISNTACALTMIPNAIAIITKLEEMTGSPEATAPFARCLLLAIPFSCSVGGFITLIGTPPNLILSQIAKDRFPLAPEIGFAQFMFLTLPTAFLILAFMYFYFVFFFLRNVTMPPNVDESLFRDTYATLGKVKAAEKVVIFLFVLLACLWLFRGDMSFGTNSTMIGWANKLFKDGATYISDGTVAMALSILLFIIHVPQPTRREETRMRVAEINLDIPDENPWPNRRTDNPRVDDTDYSEDSELREEPGDATETEAPQPTEEPVIQTKEYEWVPLLDWGYAQEKIPWQILFLFSGGFVLNQGFFDSKLDLWLGEAMKSWTNWPLVGLQLVLMIVASAVSSVASNTACANLLIPIMSVMAQNSEKIHPWLLMFPVCFMTSCTYLLPVSTPPNLIAYGYGRLTMRDFVLHGAVFTVVSLFIVLAMSLALLPPIFQARGFPDWAQRPNTTTLSAASVLCSPVQGLEHPV
jgi:di/tricarboxylate transporter